MTSKKKKRGQAPCVGSAREQGVSLETRQALTSKPDPDGPQGKYLIEGRHPLKVLSEVFESLEWELVPFDAVEHRVPDHPPSPLPVAGCDCIGCTRRPRLNRGWKQ